MTDGHARLDLEDAMELGELLGFLGYWLAGADCTRLAASLRRFVGVDGYDLDGLRLDLARFVFLLGRRRRRPAIRSRLPLSTHRSRWRPMARALAVPESAGGPHSLLFLDHRLRATTSRSLLAGAVWRGRLGHRQLAPAALIRTPIDLTHPKRHGALLLSHGS